MQCREKWHNVLDPLLDRGPFTLEDDSLIISEVNKHSSTGTSTSAPSTSIEEEDDRGDHGDARNIKWNIIAAKLSTRRTDNQVSRRWRELCGKIIRSCAHM